MPDNVNETARSKVAKTARRMPTSFLVILSAAKAESKNRSSLALRAM
jgi:hypothetical protein